MTQKVKLLKEHGTAKVGEIFIRGDILNGVPLYYKGKSNPEDWFWGEDSKMEDNKFLPASCFTEELNGISFLVIE